jgi:hypothetical protein
MAAAKAFVKKPSQLIKKQKLSFAEFLPGQTVGRYPIS